MGSLLGLFALAGTLGAVPAMSAGGATVSMTPNSAPPGASVDMCVVLSGSQGQIAGIEATLLLDPSCATAMRASGNDAECTAAAETGKQLIAVIGGARCNNSPNCVRTLLLSLDTPAPIPDGPLFCCAFTIPDSAPAGDCLVQIAQVRGSTAAGQPIVDIATQPGVLTVSGGDGDGCAVARGSDRLSIWLLLAVPVIRALRRRVQS